jgi:hypothetical protein
MKATPNIFEVDAVLLSFQKNGVSGNQLTIYTGQDDIERVGVMALYNGQPRLDYWSGEECNRIDGTDGTIFPPHLVNRNSKIYVFTGDMCRRLPLVYTEDVLVRPYILGDGHNDV